MNEVEAKKLALSMGKECLAARARILSRVVTAFYDSEARQFGLKANQGTMLVCVAIAGEIDQVRIGRTLKMEKSTVSRGIERMKAKGWIEEVDSNVHRLRLTPSGRELLGQFHVCWLRAQQKAQELIGTDGVEQLKKLTASMLRS